MAEDEALREALLELKLLRDREAAALRTTEKLLECLEVLNDPAGPRVGAQRVLETLTGSISAEAVVALEISGKEGVIRLQSGPFFVDQTVGFPFKPLKKARNIIDRGAVPGWSGSAASTLERYCSLLLQPIDDHRVLMACAEEKSAFSSEDARLFRRVAVVVGQALSSSALESENRLLAAAIQGSSSGFAIADATSDEKPLLYVNPAFETISGYSAAEAIGQNCRFLNDEPEDSEERRLLRQTVKRNGAGRFLLRNKRKSGEPFWNELTLFPVLDDSGAATHLVATQTDATVRVQAEADKEALRGRMETALKATGDAFLVLSADGQVLYANEATADEFPAKGSDWRVGSTFTENWASFVESLDTPLNEQLLSPDFNAIANLGRRQQFSLPSGQTYLIGAAMPDANT